MDGSCMTRDRDKTYIQNFGWRTEGRPSHRCDNSIKMGLKEAVNVCMN